MYIYRMKYNLDTSMYEVRPPAQTKNVIILVVQLLEGGHGQAFLY